MSHPTYRKQQTRATASQCSHHARKRAIERYNLDLSFYDLKLLANAIKRHDRNIPATFLADQDHDKALYAVDYKDQTLYALYIRSQHVIVTFLTEDMVRESIPALSDRSVPVKECLRRLRAFTGRHYRQRLDRPFEPFVAPQEWLQEDARRA